MADVLSTFVSSIIRRFKRTPDIEDIKSTETVTPNESASFNEDSIYDDADDCDDTCCDETNDDNASTDVSDEITELNNTISELKNIISETNKKIDNIEQSFEQRIRDVQSRFESSSLSFRNQVEHELSGIRSIMTQASENYQRMSYANPQSQPSYSIPHPQPSFNQNQSVNYQQQTSCNIPHPQSSFNAYSSPGGSFVGPSSRPSTPAPDIVFETPTEDEQKLIDRINKYTFEEQTIDHQKGTEIIHGIRNMYHRSNPINDHETYRIVFNKYEDLTTLGRRVCVNDSILFEFNEGKNEYHVRDLPVYMFEGNWDEIIRISELLYIEWFFTVVDSKGNFVCSWTTVNHLTDLKFN